MPGYRQYTNNNGDCHNNGSSTGRSTRRGFTNLSELTMSFVSSWAVARKHPHPRTPTADATPKGTWDWQYSYCTVVAASVFVYWLFVSLIPVYNKFFFQKSLYPYPIATAGIQLGVVAILLGILNTLQHCYRQHIARTSRIPSTSTSTNHEAGDGNPMNLRTYYQSIPEQPSTVGISVDSSTTTTSDTTINNEDSWIGGPHLLWKLKWVTPIGFLFGLKYGVTNLGLHLVAAPTHLLLQATDLVWTVLSAWLINRERLNAVEVGCLLGCIAGSAVLSWHQLHNNNSYHENELKDGNHDESLTSHPGWFAIIINLLSPMLLGLCIATLRLACCELMRPDNRVRGTVSAVELTTLKLVISASVALLLACVLEGGDMDANADQTTQLYHHAPRVSWSDAFGELPLSTKLGVMGGAILIAVFQVNCTALTYLTSAVSVGLVGQVKIIPQWIVATIFAMTTSKFTLQRDNLIGAFLIMASAAAFAGSKFWVVGGSDNDKDDPSASASTASTDDDLDPETPRIAAKHPQVTTESTRLLSARAAAATPRAILIDLSRTKNNDPHHQPWMDAAE
ncbi:expressed unknown protein [Seminavis robusta]|uniref:Uncharacterized protein n=1 Tax=Seminavis robusta TaxID=568900 RepID=A0A9N8HNZ4_9STRA|nr:expressed unknown protein [Seminavis robusta]|eukprot:Sro862_g212360.1 n/a (566) ;mRNA; f:1472-3322